MKFSVKRSNEKKELKQVEKLIKKLHSLNVQHFNCSFELSKRNNTVIYSDLKRSDLRCLKLPEHAYYKNTYIQTYQQGFVIVVYKGRDFTIYAKNSGSR